MYALPLEALGRLLQLPDEELAARINQMYRRDYSPRCVRVTLESIARAKCSDHAQLILANPWTGIPILYLPPEIHVLVADRMRSHISRMPKEHRRAQAQYVLDRHGKFIFPQLRAVFEHYINGN